MMINADFRGEESRQLHPKEKEFINQFPYSWSNQDPPDLSGCVVFRNDDGRQDREKER